MLKIIIPARLDSFLNFKHAKVNAKQNPIAKIDGIIHTTWFILVDVDVDWWTKKRYFEIMQLNILHAYGRRQLFIITRLHIH